MDIGLHTIPRHKYGLETHTSFEQKPREGGHYEQAED